MISANICVQSIAFAFIALTAISVPVNSSVSEEDTHLFDRIYNRDTTKTKCQKPIPGYKFMQYGYDIREIDIFQCPNIGGQRRRIFYLNECTNDEHYEMSETNETFHKPDNLNIYDKSLEFLEENYDSVLMSHEHSIRRFLFQFMSKNDMDEGMFTASETYNYLKARLSNTLITSIRKIRVYYELTLAVDFAKNALLSSFVAALNRLPDSYERHKNEYIEFINHYGTHYIHNIKFGGFYHKISFLNANDNRLLSRHDAKQKTLQYVQQQDSSSYEACNGSAHRIRRYFSGDRQFQVDYFGGNVTLLDTDYQEWYDSIPYNPAIVSLKLYPISHFLNDGRQRELDAAIKEFSSKRFERETMKTCNRQLPSHELLERGFDATKISLFDCPQIKGKSQKLFDLNKCEEEKEWTFNSQIYDISDAYDVNEDIKEWKQDGVLLQTIEEVRNDSDIVVHVDEEYKRGLFASSSLFRYFQDHLSNGSMVITRQFKQYYTVKQNLSQVKHSVIDSFEADIYSLPTNFDEKPLPYIEFIKDYGTHFIENAKLGGVVKRITVISDIKEESANLANGQFPITKRSGNDFINCRGESSLKMVVADKFFNYDHMEEQYYGGNIEQVVDVGSYSWIASIPLNVHLISVDLKPISSLLPNDKARELDKAVKAYMSRAHLEEVTRTAVNKINAGNLVSSEFSGLFKQVDDIRKEDIYDQHIIDAVASAITTKTNSASTAHLNIVSFLIISLIVIKISQ